MVDASEYSLTNPNTLDNVGAEVGVDVDVDASILPPAEASHFAKLVPVNNEARLAFSSVAAAIKSMAAGYTDAPFPGRFMVIEPYKSEDEMNEFAMQSGTDSFSASEAEDQFPNRLVGKSDTSLELPQFQGYYVLSFSQDPASARFGWIVGTGRFKVRSGDNSLPTFEAVEISLATLPTSYGVAGKHARFHFDRDGCLNVSKVGRTNRLTMLGMDSLTVDQPTQIISAPVTHVYFGTLMYRLELSSYENYQAELAKFMSESLQIGTPPPVLSATPSVLDYRVNDWHVKGTVGTGTYGIVSAVKHVKTGISGAAKTVMRNARNFDSTMDEIRILPTLPDDARFLKLQEVVYESGNEQWSIIPSDERRRGSSARRPEKVMMFLTPFARGTLNEYMAQEDTMSERQKLIALREVLYGLDALHTAGFMHRDIKTANIGVVNCVEDNVQIVILDFGHAKHSKTCRPRAGTVGTIPYLAPEMEVQTYDCKVDIWACGIVAYLLLSSSRHPWSQNVTSHITTYNSLMRRLRRNPEDSKYSLIADMLEWNASERVSARQAVDHPCFRGLPLRDLPSNSGKRSRSDGS